jgi:uncharacterized protein YbjT (DUF2867 family)
MILVTGGTGFVGREVVRELLSLGYTVRLLTRDPKKAAGLGLRPGVEIVAGDALKPETLSAAVAGVEAVIHLIGIIAETSRVSFEQAHVEATRNVLAAAKQAGVTRWIQMSAAGTRPHALSRYHLTKWEAEELVRHSGLDWTIFRPSLIYGYDEHDRILNLLWLVVAGPLLPLLDGGPALVQPVSVHKVAHSFAQAVASNVSLGREFDLVGPAPLSWREMIFKVAQARGRTAIYEDFPILLALRTFMWLVIAFLPVAVIAGLLLGRLSLPGAEVAVLAEVALILAANRWRQLIIFNLPAEQVRLLVFGWDAVVPRAFRFGEQLKMAVEDNVGDPRPAAAAFGYVPESFAVICDKRVTPIRELARLRRGSYFLRFSLFLRNYAPFCAAVRPCPLLPRFCLRRAERAGEPDALHRPGPDRFRHGAEGPQSLRDLVEDRGTMGLHAVRPPRAVHERAVDLHGVWLVLEREPAP